MDTRPSLPPNLIAGAERLLGARITEYDRIHGGYTGQATVRVLLDDGRTAVFKTAAPGRMLSIPELSWPELLDREIWMYEHLPHAAPYRPGHFGRVQVDGWLGLLLEDLTTADRVPPWTDEQIDATAGALAELAAMPLPEALPPDLIRRTGRLPYFERIRGRGRAAGHLPPKYTSDAWWDWFEAVSPALDGQLAELDEIRPRGFNHNDVRSDNMLFRGTRPIFLDWGQALVSTPARDSVYWSLGVERETGRAAWETHDRYLARARIRPGERAVQSVLAFWLGYFVDILQAAYQWNANQVLRQEYLDLVLRWTVRECGLPAAPIDLES